MIDPNSRLDRKRTLLRRLAVTGWSHDLSLGDAVKRVCLRTLWSWRVGGTESLAALSAGIAAGCCADWLWCLIS